MNLSNKKFTVGLSLQSRLFFMLLNVFPHLGKNTKKNWNGPVATADTTLNVPLRDLMLYLNNQMCN